MASIFSPHHSVNRTSYRRLPTITRLSTSCHPDTHPIPPSPPTRPTPLYNRRTNNLFDDKRTRSTPVRLPLLHITRSVSIFIRHRRSSFLTNLTLYYTFLPPIMQDFKCEVCLKIVPAQPRISGRKQFSNTLWRMPLICGKMSTYQKSKRCALL